MRRIVSSLLAALFAAALPISSSTAAEVAVSLVTGLDFAPGFAANDDSFVRAASPDGRFLLIDSQSSNLAAGPIDANSAPDVLVLDRQSGSFDLVSLRAGLPARSAAAPGGSRGIAISDDGRWVLFESAARDIVAGVSFPGGPEDRQIFLFDRASRAVQLVSRAHGSPATAGDAPSAAVALTADGRYALFSSGAGNLLASGRASGDQVYLFDRDSGTHRLLSHRAGAPELPGSGYSLAGDLSADGRYALFSSNAGDLVAGQIDDPHSEDVFLFDRTRGTVELLSRDPANSLAAVGGTARDLSPDGRFVLLASAGVRLAADLLDGNDNGYDVFLLDRQSAAMRLVSCPSSCAGQSGNRGSWADRVSDDGRFVYFWSSADDLVAEFTDRNGSAAPDVYLFDAAGGLRLVSHAAGDLTGGANAAVQLPAVRQNVSPDGRYALLETAAGDLDPGVADANHALDRYLYDRESGQAQLVSRYGGSTAAGGAAMLDADLVLGDGQVFFSSAAPLDADAKDPHQQIDVFRFDGVHVELVSVTSQTGRSTLPRNSRVRFGHDPRWVVWGPFLYDARTGRNEVIGHPAEQPGVADLSTHGQAVTADGNFVLYESFATYMAAGVSDGNDGPDLFFYDRAAQKATLLSCAAGAPLVTANGASKAPRLSPDGRFVGFDSEATDLVAGMAAGQGSQVFLHDRSSGETSLVSHTASSPAAAGSGESNLRALDPAGRWLVFRSNAQDLVPGFEDRNGGAQDLYFYDRESATARLVTRRPGSLAEGSAATESTDYEVHAAADGAAVFYTSAADDLVAGQVPRPGQDKIFRWDGATGVNQLVATLGGDPAAPCAGSVRLADLSADGRWLLLSGTCRLVPGDTNDLSDVYLLDRSSGGFTLISHLPGRPGISSGVPAFGATLSDDGRLVGLLQDDSPYSYDRATGEATLLGFAYFDPQERVASGGISPPALLASADGTRLLYGTYESKATPFDANARLDFHLAVLGDLFADGFECGDTGGWSQAVP